MFDIFTDQIEVLIKDGIANLYWYKGDLQKAWLRSGVPQQIATEIASLKDEQNRPLTKRRQMDALYERFRAWTFDERLQVSRNFVRLLVEHRNFVPQDPKHRIEVAERSALKLRELIQQQENEREQRDRSRRSATAACPQVTYHSELLLLREEFDQAHSLSPQKKGYALEKLFTALMRISHIPVEEPFRIVGEQLDGAIKHDGHYYLVELKWFADKLEPKEIGHFYFKVEGKFDARGIVIAMNGYTGGVLDALPRGKQLRVILLDGVHFANVLYGHYTFQELLEHAISSASLKGDLYCTHKILK